jgi:Ser/Thr protein kinase RdoA (MazF antagonist)
MQKNLPLHLWKEFEGQTAFPLEGGLINGTWCVGEPARGVLQSLSPIFRPEVNLDIHAITEHLISRSLHTPQLIPTKDGELWHIDEDKCCWRALTWLPGETHHKLRSSSLAYSAGRQVAHWHSALTDFEHVFHFSRPGAHDTPAHMVALQDALGTHSNHRLYDSVAPLAEGILESWRSWGGSLESSTRLCHGDLKVSNLRFTESGEAFALLDLDTMGYMPLEVELGDAWRSWCNPAAEDVDNAQFDLGLFEASAKGYLSRIDLTSAQREALPMGVERICLELSARFAADALNEAYFGWNPSVARTQGEHNLMRAQGQYSLACSVRGVLSPMTRILG